MWVPATATGDVEPPLSPPVALYFSPNGGARQAIIDQINSAETEILVAAYSLTSAPITESLVAASRRGVRIHIVLDRRVPTARKTQYPAIRRASIDTRVDRIHQLMHQKVIVIDRRVLLTGSYNFTDNAELRNSEILLVITDPATASKVAARFETLYKLSTPAHLVSPGRK